MRRERVVPRRGDDPGEPPTGLDEGGRLQALLHARDHEGAFALLHGCAGRLRGYLRARFEASLGGAQAVEEVIAAAIWSAIERGATYRAELGAPGFWLWRIGVNAAQDELRKAATRRRHESTVARESEQASDPARGELQAAVRDAIARLPNPKHRAILSWDLAHGGLAPSAAIAEKLGLAEQTVLNLRSEARRVVRPMLEELLRHG